MGLCCSHVPCTGVIEGEGELGAWSRECVCCFESDCMRMLAEMQETFQLFAMPCAQGFGHRRPVAASAAGLCRPQPGAMKGRE